LVGSRGACATATLAAFAIAFVHAPARQARSSQQQTQQAQPAQQPQQEPPKRPLQDGARVEQYQLMLADKNGAYGPAAGGGTARLGGSTPCVVGSTGPFPLESTAGPLGIAVGGAIFLQVSPFWGWSTPQTATPDSLGYTEVSCPRADVKLAPET